MEQARKLLERLRLSERITTSSFLQLFFVSVASLYVEIMLIRWVGTEFRLFAHFQNLALIACFLGFGYGCLKPITNTGKLFDYGALCALVVIINLPWRGWKQVLELIGMGLASSQYASTWVTASQDLASFRNLLVSGAFIAGVLLLLIAAMVPLGSWVAHYLERIPNTVVAYSLNLAGSLAGIWIFAGLSFLRLPPVWWFGAAFVLALLMQPHWRKTGPATLAALTVCTVVLALDGNPEGRVAWSPYQKLEIIPVEGQNYNIRVNNAGYMTIADLTPEGLAKEPEMAKRYRAESSYDTPFQFVERLDRVLIIGSGAGNDIAAALRHRAQSIDAVEIDPAIRDFGRAYHPEHPYDSPRVHVTIDDARDYMHRAEGRYDLILFALLDSHTQSSSLSSLRIDNYVFTQEAFTEAKRLLSPEGILVLKFEVLPDFDWLGQRFFKQLTAIFGHPPVVYYNSQLVALLPGTIYLESTDGQLEQKSRSPELTAFLSQHPPRFSLPPPSGIHPATDDWPYVYQKDRAIPRVYLILSGIVLGLAIVLVRKSFAYRRARTWHFFLLGAGFLLLETQMISRLALFFGSTWIVNCIALTFLLIVLVAANAYLSRFPVQSLGPCYGLLLAALLLIFLVPWTQLPFPTRISGILLASAYSVPLFFAGIIFTENFRRQVGSSECFGANILGAVAGGLTQNLSFLIGMKALLLVAFVFYGAAALFQFKGQTEPLATGATR